MTVSCWACPTSPTTHYLPLQLLLSLHLPLPPLPPLAPPLPPPRMPDAPSGERQAGARGDGAEPQRSRPAGRVQLLSLTTTTTYYLLLQLLLSLHLPLPPLP